MFHRSNRIHVLDILLFQLNPNSRFLIQNIKGVKSNYIKDIMNYNKFVKVLDIIVVEEITVQTFDILRLSGFILMCG